MVCTVSAEIGDDGGGRIRGAYACDDFGGGGGPVAADREACLDTGHGGVIF